MNTEPAIPAERLSAAIVSASSPISLPDSARTTNIKLVSAISTAPSSSGRMMPNRTTSVPPRIAPAMVMAIPNTLVTEAISAKVKPRSM